MSGPHFFDSHAHLTFPQFTKEERSLILHRSFESGVTRIMNVCTNEQSLLESFELDQKNVNIHLAAATPPHDLKESIDPFFDVVSRFAHSGTLAAIGETGFDFYHSPHMKAEQEHVFAQYAQLATKTSLPLIVHCRNAFSTLLPIIREFPSPLRGVLHCFSGTKEDASTLLDLGWHLSLSGTLTYKKSETLRTIAAYIPLDRLLIETDAPYLPPEPFRGKRNEPSLIVYTAQMVALIRNISLEELAKATYDNACKLFDITAKKRPLRIMQTSF